MGEVSVCDVCVCVCVCACSSAYFFRPDVFTVQRFFAFCLVALMGRFVPLPGTAFFCGTTSTPEEEVEEEEDEEEEELLPSSEVAALSLPLDESLSAEDLDSTELASSSGFQSQSERPREASENDALSLSTAFATFKVILGFITMGIFLARPFSFSSSCPTTTHSVKSTVLGGTVGWQLSPVSFDVQNPRGGTAPGNRTFTGHVFSFARGHCELQWAHTRACATDFLAHNTFGTRACWASTKTTRFGLTMHPWVRYHLSFLQVHCHMMTHPCQRNGHSTKQTKFCFFRGPHASMCHTSV